MSVTKYYAYVPLGDSEPADIFVGDRSEPSGVFRFFADKNRSPQYFKKGDGWVDDPDLLLEIAKGELTDQDAITDKEASELVTKWGGSL